MDIQSNQEGVPLVRTMMRIGIPLVIMSIALFVVGLVLWNTALRNGDEDTIIRQWVVSYYLMYGSVIIGVAGLILVVLSWAVPKTEDEVGDGSHVSMEGETEHLDPSLHGPVSDPILHSSHVAMSPDIAEDMPVEDAILFCETCHHPNVPGTLDCTKCGRPL